MEVVLDGRLAFHSGIGRYVRELARALLALPERDVSLTMLVEPRIAGRTREATGVQRTIDFAASAYTLREQLCGVRVCRDAVRRSALVHFPHYNAPWRSPANRVVTVHDLTQLERAAEFGRLRARAAEALFRKVVGGAAHVITVSDATRRALEARVPRVRGRVTTVHHGVASGFRPLSEPAVRKFRREQGMERCFLFVGRDRPYKNLTCLLEAFSGLNRRHPGVRLALAGTRGGPLPEMRAAAAPEAPANRAAPRRLPVLSDDELAGWYNAAVALVLPSRAEGFGFPVLEAMACGTPVIASDRPALREVAGDAALFVDGDDPIALRSAMERVLGDTALRERLRAIGLRRAATFTWERAARRTRDVYRAVAG